MHRRTWLIAVLVVAPTCAFASPNGCGVVQTSVDRERAYASVVAAVDAMRRAHLERSVRSDREFVGAVVENGAGGYWTSVGSGCSGQDTVTFAVQVPLETRVAAFWHTHGAAAALRDLFSPDDVDLVRSTGRDFYLITPRGEIRVLRPGDVARIGAIGVSRIPANRATIGHAVKANGANGQHVAKQNHALPTASRGDAPIG
jgi:hypothetical protein